MHRLNIISFKRVIESFTTEYFIARDTRVWNFPNLPIDARSDLTAGELCDYLYAIVAFNLHRATEKRTVSVE